MPRYRDPDTSSAIVILAIPLALIGLYFLVSLVAEVAAKGWP